MKQNKFKIWLLAARPKTLTAALAPIIVSTGLALRNRVFDWKLTLVCLVFALLLQVVSNFANDYFDCRKGSDNAERLGPERAVAQGWISPRAMLAATLLLLAAACVLGLLLMWLVSWKLIFVGATVAVFALAYSGGKYPLAYHGWGDVCVLAFFGIVPVVFTYFVQARTFSPSAFVCGAALGLVTINILVSNNYRDYQSDKNAGKRTSIVIFGKKFGRYFYLLSGIAATVLCQYFWLAENWRNALLPALLPVIYLFLHIKTWQKMLKIEQGKELIVILEKSAQNTLIFSVLLFAGLII